MSGSWIKAWTVTSMLAASAAQGETLYQRDGITLEGTVRIETREDAVCQVLPEQHPAEMYERMKANHGRPLHVWRLDFTARNGSGRRLEHLAAHFSIASEAPPCTTWNGPLGNYAKPVQWANSFQVLQEPDGMQPDEEVSDTVFVLAFHDRQPEFESWNVDYRFADEAGREVEPVLGAPAFIVVAVPTHAKVLLLNTAQPYRRRMLLEPGRYQVEVSAPGYGTQRVWVDHKQTWPHRIELERLPGEDDRASMNSPSGAAGELPPGIMADRYLRKAEQAVRDGDITAIREAMARVVSLQEEHGLEPAAEDHYRYAQAWEVAGEPERAMESVVQYLQLRGRQAEHYTEALDLMNRAESAQTGSATGVSEGDRVGLKVPQPGSSQLSERPEPAIGEAGARKLASSPPPEMIAARDLLRAERAVRDQGIETARLAMERLQEAEHYTEASDLTNRARSDRAAASAGILGGSTGESEVPQLLLNVTSDPVEKPEPETASGGARELVWVPPPDAAVRPETWCGSTCQASGQTATQASGQTATQAGACKNWNTTRFFEIEGYTIFDGHGAGPKKTVTCLEAGADPMARDFSGRTPLHLAAAMSRHRMLEELRAAGADPMARDFWGRTPLHYAVSGSGDRMNRTIEVLVAAGADPMARDEEGRTPLHLAAGEEYGEDLRRATRALLASGADLEASDSSGRTPLHLAAGEGVDPKTLLAFGPNLEARDEEGRTPLHLAALFWFKSNVKGLLAAGADPRARDNSGRTPLEVAKAFNKENPGVAKVLASARSTSNKPRSDGRGLGALIAGVTAATVGAASGLDTAEALEVGTSVAGSVLTGQATVTSTGGGAVPGDSGLTGSAAGGGSCLIPGYPSPPGGLAGVGLPWCPASVDFQVRAFALQAAGIQCAVAAASPAPPEVLSRARGQIGEVCSRLAAMSARDGTNCRCPAGFGP